MKPYYCKDGITIYHGDCREILHQLPIHDIVLTDPPYGIGERMNGGTWGAAQKYADFRAWDVAPEPELIARIIAHGNSVIMWGGNYFSMPPSRCWLAWDKQNAVPTMADCEFAWTNLDRPAKRFSWPVGQHDSGHPTEKPLPLIKWAMSLCEGNTVLDPFMGSGTTLRAAKDLGRRAIGIEIDGEYCEIAAKRMAQQVFAFTG